MKQVGKHSLNLYLPDTETSRCTDSTIRTGGAGGTSLVNSPANKVTSRTIVADIVLCISVTDLLITVDDVSTANILSCGPNKLCKMTNC